MLPQFFERYHKLILASLLVGGVLILSGTTVQALMPQQNLKKSLPPLNPVPKTEPQIVIDIAGAVIHPGIYSFINGSRIDQAVKAAGGLSEQADQSYIERNLNLSEKLTDGMKIYIPSINEVTTDLTIVSNNTSLVNINTASSADLDNLPGVTPTAAQKIIAKRPYQTLDQLVQKKVISQTVYDKMKKQITLN